LIAAPVQHLRLKKKRGEEGRKPDTTFKKIRQKESPCKPNAVIHRVLLCQMVLMVERPFAHLNQMSQELSKF
jgi:hypothetical protein